MTISPDLHCRDDRERRHLVRSSPLNGLDYLEVSEDQRQLTVFFLDKAPDWITARHLRIEGGRRVRDIRVVRVKVNRSADPEQDDCMTVIVDQPGDASTYTLCVVAVDADGRPTDGVPADIDPRYACLCFSFKAGCPGDLDCRATPACPATVRPEPSIDYLAKDYTSFRRLMLDRLALVMPDWQERHVPDLGITLVELLAYAGDHLSYYQDAVATEAYLETARQRVSVRRHARLVDYVLHEGCNARAWVHMALSQQTSHRLHHGDVYFTTTATDGGARHMLRADDLQHVSQASHHVFEPLSPQGELHVDIYEAHNEIRFYTWHESRCCLPKGSTSATLVDPGTVSEPPPDEDCGDGDGVHQVPPRGQKPPPKTPHTPRPEDYRLHLKRCDVLIFEEVKGAATGDPADADPTHRHAVRLTSVRPSLDPLTGELVVEVEWAPEDALPFALCISSIGPAPDCRPIPDVSVARGNIVLVDHGRRVDDELGQVPTRAITGVCDDGCEGPVVRKRPGLFRPTLPRTDLTCAEPLPPCEPAEHSCAERARINGASSLLRQDPRAALPWVTVRSIPAAPNGAPSFTALDLDDPSRLAKALVNASPDASQPAGWLRGQLPVEDLSALSEWVATRPLPPLPDALRDRIRSLLQSLEETWLPRHDLLGSGPDDRHVVVEIDDIRAAHVRFGDGDTGRVPDAGTSFRAGYRVGNGSAGNVGAETITTIVWRTGYPSGIDLRSRNPLPAAGGQEPELVAEARLRAPHVLRTRLERAITADDYAAIVTRDFASRVQRAAAVMRWNGIGPQVEVAVDARGQADPDPELLCEVERHLHTFRRLGHDLHVTTARVVPLDVELSVCVERSYTRGYVKAALLDVFGNRLLPGGERGLFHPDSVTFGQSVYASQMVAAAQAVAGVESVHVGRLERLFEGSRGELEAGVLQLGPLEVARLDNDPSVPENGRLTLTLEGGR